MKERKAGWLILTGCIISGLLFVRQPEKSVPAKAAVLGASKESASQDFLGQGILLYVSAEGDDACSGTLVQPNAQRTDGPFRNLQAARDAIRKLKARGPLAQPITVYVRGGVYELPETLVFTAEDSGTEKCPIRYAAYPDEVPVLSGGRRITGWKRATEPGHADLWQAEVPGVKEGKWYFRQLFVDGQRCQRARMPNRDFFHVEGSLTRDNPARFHFREGNIRGEWARTGYVELVILQAWTVMRTVIRAVDEGTRTVTLSDRQVKWGREANARYWVENTLDVLDSPGEFYLNRKTGELYYCPRPGEDMTHVQVIAPVLQQLVRFEGNVWGDSRPAGLSLGIKPVHDIRLCGLTLSYADWSMPPDGHTEGQNAFNVPGAVEAAGASSIAIEKCVFKHLGQYAIEFAKGCKGNRIIGNEMTDLGAGGVKIGEPNLPKSDMEVTSGNVISDNRIHDIGAVFPAAAGVWVGESSGNTISHNEIFDTYQNGIAVGWTWGYGPAAARANIIEYNHIHHIGRGMLGDMGCIYTLGVQPETVVRNNLCHDVTRYEQSYGGWGIYTDEGSRQILIENNVVLRTQDAGFHQNYGQDNTIRNNIFAFGQEAQLRRTVNEKGFSFSFEHNIVYWKDGVLLDSEWSDNNYKFDNNLYFRVGDAGCQSIRFGELTLEAWQKKGQDQHSIIADPLFRDPAKGDFSLEPGSPTVKIGFKPIDLGSVGPRTVQKLK